jgi:hypothetical protein
MSTLNVNRIVDASGGVLAPISSVMRNRIINGAMTISQRNGTSSVTPANLDYSLDRFQAWISASSKFTIQQNAGSVTPPVGFINYLGVTSSSAYSVSAGDYFAVRQPIEGLNITDLGWGTANAKTVTLSFQVYSSLTGTFGGSLGNSNYSRTYPFTYTVSSANTWTTISVTIAGDTSGTWLTTNGVGIYVTFGLGVGSTYSGTANTWSGSFYISPTGATSVVGTNGATFYITGVQLEVGTQATGFEYRQYGTELALCQRYFEVVSMNGLGGASSTTAVAFGCSYKVQKRATPTVVNASSTAALYSFYRPGLGSGDPSSVSISSDLGDSRNFNITLANFSGLTNNQAWVGRYEGLFNASAEL